MVDIEQIVIDFPRLARISLEDFKVITSNITALAEGPKLPLTEYWRAFSNRLTFSHRTIQIKVNRDDQDNQHVNYCVYDVGLIEGDPTEIDRYSICVPIQEQVQARTEGDEYQKL